jgi:hypothetical protein
VGKGRRKRRREGRRRRRRRRKGWCVAASGCLWKGGEGKV